MPTGPKGEKRPADPIANAVRVMRIATGEERETHASAGQREGGRKGGKARAEGMSAERRREIAKKAASARWAS
ncbi:MAG: RNA-binding protein [Gammaproteobacteria bacterium]|nr:RNA-binding protein [Gammaproteobacteria bacterium]